jgi:hypothetical protein
VAQEEIVQAQAPQNAEKDPLAAKEIICLARDLTDDGCQMALRRAQGRLASAAS